MIDYRPIVEELADIILSADISTVEAIQHRYGEQVNEDFQDNLDLHFRYRFHTVFLQLLWKFV